ncbi:peroxiredoxin (alkyl hydroperoxide reductase subunit C) [Sedimentibacter acidaminivorans]|uniref:Peroxiredoxin (Alkyl hydroperoxide reductase subunit C) n=1 Tax=Sedimentibacter acidaminivorans TaxID=913099 RepID=A0ABS4GG99_9FIRM|nr:peroxiredoxin [Sedimentibacter acidaminivorans]MBP1926723.1 peroxiredoxin (alkyl hydroperoxide reductase subunit C) [Sedimentibacter acidaminivorans]
MISNDIVSANNFKNPSNCITIGRMAPDFTDSSTQGVITLSKYREKWVLLFSEPVNFGPISTTELIAFTQLYAEFEKRNVQLLCITIDSTFSDIEWLMDIYKATGLQVPFPLLADRDAEIANLYGMVNPDRIYEESVRDAFIINPGGKIAGILTYPVSCGRNLYEILRMIDSLQLTYENNVYTPANWIPGQPVVVPPPHTFEEALQRENEGESLGLNCSSWFLCYKD